MIEKNALINRTQKRIRQKHYLVLYQIFGILEETTKKIDRSYIFPMDTSRLYARYFNGDLEIHSIDGHGTDAYIYLQAVEDQASEWLPICNRAAYEYYVSRKYQSDWTKKK
ncbi:unnamed protein product [Rotaria socialis]|uniref:Protein-serine/threonine kinase n=1 Tax=Rotaria socialis TaxID=392032 RepID=A0A821ZUF9_9BILA|nr:unnamed protein product [Rotaria socialis]